jgi:UDP-2,4-diacetamido-2,4,6-trideoxy-beta-L-altropyranose hydrolase
MTSGPLLFRADADVAMGTGHVMRCLALAQAWQDAGGRSVFALAKTTPAIQDRLLSESFEIVAISSPAGTLEDSREIVAIAGERQVAWVVVDGYQFGADYQGALKSSGMKTLFLDDYGHARQYSADLVLNPNVCATEALYQDREP